MIALVPCRAGSKRVKGKNFRMLEVAQGLRREVNPLAIDRTAQMLVDALLDAGVLKQETER